MEVPSDRDALFQLVYDELRSLASSYLHKERRGHTLQTTALLHEAFVRLLGIQGASWPNVAAFRAAAATAMRRVLVDYAKRRDRLKRGGKSGKRVPLNENVLAFSDDSFDLAALDRGLTELKRLDARAAAVVELRFFGGLTEEEVGQVLDQSRRTVSKDWRFARAWLREWLEDQGFAT
jgi:RNA polymerase sigma-70 factor (ECF subfamily)